MKKNVDEKKIRKPISISPALSQKLDKIAQEKTGGNFSFLACRIFEAYLEGKIKLAL